MPELIVIILSFALIALAAGQVGKLFTRIRLPLISGFLLTGILAGPYSLGLISHEALEGLRFVDDIALAFIAFTAGSELFLKEFQERLKTIAWVTFGLVVSTLTLGTFSMLLLSQNVAFMQGMEFRSSLAVALLVGTILVARSPSAAIAIINEVRAKGPFTMTALGVTVIMDIVVISLFAINLPLASALITGLGLNFSFILLLVLQLALSFGLGYVLAKILIFIMSSHGRNLIKILLILFSGYLVFILVEYLHEVSLHAFHLDLRLEPLLICMVAGFWVTNRSRYRMDFTQILHDSGLPVYIAFFTLTGASLELDVLARTWPIALALFFTRLLGIFIGSFGGGVIAGEPMRHNWLRWMSFVTQAGVGLGLATEASVAFPEWGAAFATLIISVIVLNEIIGPIFFKWSINLVGEAHPKAPAPAFDGIRDAFIFGLERQSIFLARQLQARQWQVKLIALEEKQVDLGETENLDLSYLVNLNRESLSQLDIRSADAIVCMEPDDERNYQICRLVYENFGTPTVVVRLNDRSYFERFHDLGVQIVDPSMATVQLLEEFVRSPSTTSLLLGMTENQDIVEIEIRDPLLHGTALRDLRLPLDTLILSIRRKGQKVLITHGYTKLELGDRVTLVGSVASLDAVSLRFGRE
ncbi:MAG: cation:proton antiporter [Trueperaceae bacterium]|nr:cation:proton antiporter [Trueperaceae bacterium]